MFHMRLPIFCFIREKISHSNWRIVDVSKLRKFKNVERASYVCALECNLIESWTRRRVWNVSVNNAIESVLFGSRCERWSLPVGSYDVVIARSNKRLLHLCTCGWRCFSVRTVCKSFERPSKCMSIWHVNRVVFSCRTVSAVHMFWCIPSNSAFASNVG